MNLRFLGLGLLTAWVAGCGGGGVSSSKVLGDVVFINGLATQSVSVLLSNAPLDPTPPLSRTTGRLFAGTYPIAYLDQAGGTIATQSVDIARDTTQLALISPIGPLAATPPSPNSGGVTITIFNAQGDAFDLVLTDGSTATDSPLLRYDAAPAGSVYHAKLPSQAFRLLALLPGTNVVVADSTRKFLGPDLYGTFFVTDGVIAGSKAVGFVTSQ